ncbi:MAG: thiol reductase thioredoxin [Bacteroidales bacterium]|nr:thiol reductase thioredoxin [Bacteroidales bacterium]
MRRIFFINLVLLITILIGCGNSSDNMKVTREKESINTENTYQGTIKLTKQDFLEKVMNYEKNPNVWVFEGTKPCLIDFYADWCAPCKITAPILEELAIEYHNKIHIYKIDVQKEQELAAVFGVQSIPAFLFCPLEGQPRMSAGIARTPEETKAMFKQMIDEYLLNEI